MSGENLLLEPGGKRNEAVLLKVGHGLAPSRGTVRKPSSWSVLGLFHVPLSCEYNCCSVNVRTAEKQRQWQQEKLNKDTPLSRERETGGGVFWCEKSHGSARRKHLDINNPNLLLFLSGGCLLVLHAAPFFLVYSSKTHISSSCRRGGS